MARTLAICLAVLAGRVAPADAQQRASFPLEPGLTWTYRGYVRWAGSDQRVHGDSITWTTKIVVVRTGPAARAALVRGWVQDLAWHEPSKQPAYGVLILRGGQLYHIAADDSVGATVLVESSVRAGAPAPERSGLVFDSTVAIGRVAGRDTVTVEYRSLPDYQAIDLVPGVGITRFVYVHHGTVAETDVRLRSVRR